MRIKIKSIKDILPQGIKVDFDSDFGQGEGTWMDQNVQVGGIYHVEMEIPTELIWGEDVTPSLHSSTSIRYQDDYTFLWGKVESICASIIAFRLGNSLLQIDVSSHEATVGDMLRIRTKDVLLYDEKI